jgi:glyoxalase family protein
MFTIANDHDRDAATLLQGRLAQPKHDCMLFCRMKRSSFMPPAIAGLHHVTAIIGKPQPNIDFYTGVLGLRMVKLTVNYDDHETYHLYYGDRVGSPGTAITFFPWPDAPKGTPGVGQVIATAYAVPRSSLGWWREHLQQHDISTTAHTRMGEPLLSLVDPDDLHVELIGTDALPDVQPWSSSTVPTQHAIHGFHSVTLAVARHEPTNEFLSNVYQFRMEGKGPDDEDNRVRFVAANDGPGGIVDVCVRSDLGRGDLGPGTVHHVAWRCADDEAHCAWHEVVSEAGRFVTEIKDRNYFRSIYFREPGGVIFEMATDGPGMTIDEDEASLGTQLQIPPAAASRRQEIESKLPPLKLPTAS